jgi:hypothetical protein
MKMQKNIYVKSSDGNGTIHRLSKKFAKIELFCGKYTKEGNDY